MDVFDLLRLSMPELSPEQTKIHLAGWNGEEDPVQVYLAGRFNDWQSWQSRRNFEREYVLSLIALPGHNRWLFAGIYQSQGSEFVEDEGRYLYALEPVKASEELNGRLIVNFSRPGRQSYLNAESWYDSVVVSEYLPEPYSIGEFPGFKDVALCWDELEMIVRQSIESWRSALSSVAGVYVISDAESGKLYVGSASGEGGIWQRWAQYSANGHGDNIELVTLLKDEGLSRARHFRYSILEIADTHANSDDVLRRESHWKEVLMTRVYGLNRN